MNTHDIELPAEFRSGNDIPVTQATIKRERMEEIIRAAIDADRKRRAPPNEPFAIVIDRMYEGEGPSLAYWNGENYQFSDGDCYNREGDTLDGYTAEFLTDHQLEKRLFDDRKRRGEPVDIRQEVIETLEMILAADWRKWEELASPDEFVRWAKSRANYALSIINEAPQPAAPSHTPTDTKQRIYDLAQEAGAARYPSLSETKIDSLCFDPASFERFCERLLEMEK